MSTINFADKIFAMEALQAFNASIVPFNAFTKSYSSLAGKVGDAIVVPRVDVLSTTTFAYANNSDFPYEGSGGTVNAITVNLNNHQIVQVDITDIQAANSSPAEAVTFARQQGRALAKKVQQSVWASLIAANFGSAITAVSIASYGLSQLRAVRNTLMKRDVPKDQLSFIVNEDVYTNLLGDSNVTKALEYGGSEAIREGRIPRLIGANVYSTNILPANSISLVGMLVHPDSIALACRALIPQNPERYDAFEVLTADNGLTMGYRRHYNPGRGKMYANFECLFGFSVGLTLGLGLFAQTD